MSGSNSVVESQPSKLLVAGSIPVSRSKAVWSARRGRAVNAEARRAARGEGVHALRQAQGALSSSKSASEPAGGVHLVPPMNG